MNARLHQPSPQSIALLAAELREGRLVAVPTETVYGLAGDALNEQALRQIFAVKERPHTSPLILHLPSPAHAERCATRLPEAFHRLTQAFWPGPLTLVVPRAETIPTLVSAGLNSVALRSPAHPAFRALLKAFDGPLAAPSANRFSQVSPTSAEHVRESLGDRIEHILDGGPCQHGLESTVLSLLEEQPRLLRHGPIGIQALEQCLGQPVSTSASERVDEQPAHSPGQSSRHYSPRTPLILCDKPLEHPLAGEADTGLLLHKANLDDPSERCLYTSQSGALEEVARNLFARLRELDTRGYKRLISVRVPAEGLGAAINDRLERAACTTPNSSCSSEA